MSAITTCPHGTQVSAALDLRCGLCERDAPQTHQDAIPGVLSPQGLSDPTAPVVDALHAALRARAEAAERERDMANRVAQAKAQRADAHERRAERLAGLLRRLEWLPWGADDPICAFCHALHPAGHAPDCEWVAALADARGAESALPTGLRPAPRDGGG